MKKIYVECFFVLFLYDFVSRKAKNGGVNGNWWCGLAIGGALIYKRIVLIVGKEGFAWV